MEIVDVFGAHNPATAETLDIVHLVHPNLDHARIDPQTYDQNLTIHVRQAHEILRSSDNMGPNIIVLSPQFVVYDPNRPNSVLTLVAPVDRLHGIQPYWLLIVRTYAAAKRFSLVHPTSWVYRPVMHTAAELNENFFESRVYYLNS
jgi:hypothetical protein